MGELTQNESKLLRQFVRQAAYKPIILTVGETDISIPINIFSERKDCWVVNANMGDDYALCMLAKQMNWNLISINARVTDSQTIAKAFPQLWWFDIVFVNDNPGHVEEHLAWEKHRHLNGVFMYKNYNVPNDKAILDDYISRSNMKIRGQADNLVAFR